VRADSEAGFSMLRQPKLVYGHGLIITSATYRELSCFTVSHATPGSLFAVIHWSVAV
jgi:hypothetical protein